MSGAAQLAADVTTTGSQTYGGAVTLAASTVTLTGTTITTSSTVAGGGNALAVVGDAVVNGAISGVSDYSVSGAAQLAADVTTTGSQTYGGAVTLAASTVTLTGTTITTSSTVAGGGNALAVVGDAVVNGAISGVSDYSVSGAAQLAADVTSSGAQTYNGAVTLLSDITLTASAVTTQSTVTGAGHSLTVISDAVVNGAVSGLSNLLITGTTAVNADVTTSGTHSYGGDVTLTKSATLASTGGKSVTFAKAITSAAGLANSLTVITTGVTTLTGNVGGPVGGPAVLGALKTGTGATLLRAPTVNTSGADGQIYRGPLLLGVDVVISSGNAATAAPVTFQATVDSLSSGTPVNLTVNASSRTQFLGLVGGTNPINALSTNAGYGRTDTGVTRFDAPIVSPQATVTTVGSQVYGDDVVLGRNAVLVSTGNAGIGFGRTVTSAGNVAATLEIVTAGTTSFDGAIGGAIGGPAVLGALKTGTGATLLRAPTVNTSGADGQIYRGPLLLGVDVVISSGNAATAAPVTFQATVDSLRSGTPVNLTVNASGPTTFKAAVGATNLLNTLSTNAGYGRSDTGVTLFNVVPVVGTATVRTLGGQFHSDDVMLLQDTLLRSTAGGAVTFSRTVLSSGGTWALAVDTTGTTTFTGAVGGAIGGTAALRSLEVRSGQTVLATPLVNTSGLDGQTYAGAVTLTASARIEAGAGPVTFRSSLDSVAGAAANLAVHAGGATRFTGPVGRGAPLASLTTAGGDGQPVAGTTFFDGGLVATSGAGGQSYLDRVVLGVDTSFTSGPNGSLVFRDSLDGAVTSSFAAGSGAVNFFGPVGGIVPLRGLVLASASSVFAAQPIVLDGTNPAAATDGLVVGPGVNSVTIAVPGGSVSGFRGTGIVFGGTSTNSLLAGFDVRLNGIDGITVRAGNYSGTRLQNNRITDNGRDGVYLDPTGGSLASLIIGGASPAEGNTIAGNASNGIETSSGSLSGVVIAGNSITANGNSSARTGNGILVRGSGAMIGWDTAPFPGGVAPAPSNTIQGNGLNGIEIAAGSGTSILSNAIFKNGVGTEAGAVGKGISLGASGTGNDGQVAPEIRKLVWDRRDGVVRVELVVPADGQYFVQLWRNLPSDEEGVAPVDTIGFEGHFLVAPVRPGQPLTSGKPAIAGAGVVRGNTLETLEIPASSLTAGDWLTATATLLAGTSPGSTSEFSRAVQVTAYPALAVGGDSFGTTWNPEFPYKVQPSTTTTIRLENLSKTQIEVFETVGTLLTLTASQVNGDVVPATIVKGTLANDNPSAVDVELDFRPQIGFQPPAFGTLSVGWSSLPAARLYDTSTQMPATGVGTIGAAEIRNALEAPIPGPVSTITIDSIFRNAFVGRFQGGLRVASADFDGDGFVDLVTVPGGVPVAPSGTPGSTVSNIPNAKEFGDTFRIVTIYNGSPNPGLKWTSSSFNLGGMFDATFSPTDTGSYSGGFLVTTGDVRSEAAGSKNAVTELIVASSSESATAPHRVVVLDVTRTNRGDKPIIGMTTGRIDVGATITGLTAGAFSSAKPGRADILVATTKAEPGAWMSQTPILDTSKVSILSSAGAGLEVARSFFINALVENGPPGSGTIQNAFLYGASLALGDINDDFFGKADLVLGSGEIGLSNVRVIKNSIAVSGSQAAIDAALLPTGDFGLLSPRSPATSTSWQPGNLIYRTVGQTKTLIGGGGPDYYTGENVPMPFGNGFMAPFSIAVVEPNGRAFDKGGNGFGAEVFAALGAPNQSGNLIRSFAWSDATKWRRIQPQDIKVVEIDKSRLHEGEGLRLG